MQQVLDVVEGESELLGAVDEAHYPHRIEGVGAVPAAGPFRFGQQAAAFVVPQGLGVDLRLGGDLAGSHPTSMNPVPSYQVKASSTSIVRCPSTTSSPATVSMLAIHADPHSWLPR